MATVDSATRRLTPARPGLVQLGLVGLLLVLAAIAWVATGDRMAGMDAGPGTDPGTLGFYVTAWVVMMAAMMFPSIWPMVTMYSQIQEGRRARGRDAPLGRPRCSSADTCSPGPRGASRLCARSARQLDLADALSWDRGGLTSRAG